MNPVVIAFAVILFLGIVMTALYFTGFLGDLIPTPSPTSGSGTTSTPGTTSGTTSTPGTTSAQGTTSTPGTTSIPAGSTYTITYPGTMYNYVDLYTDIETFDTAFVGFPVPAGYEVFTGYELSFVSKIISNYTFYAGRIIIRTDGNEKIGNFVVRQPATNDDDDIVHIKDSGYRFNFKNEGFFFASENISVDITDANGIGHSQPTLIIPGFTLTLIK